MVHDSVQLPEVVLFDVGGTLVELAAEPMTIILARTLDPPIDADRLGLAFEQVLGAPDRAPATTADLWEKSYRRVLLTAGYRGDLDTAVQRMWRFWLEPKICPEVPEALAALAARGHRLGVISNWAPRLDETLANLGIGSLFEVVVCSSLVGSRKPDPEIFRVALRTLAVTPEQCLYVGDDFDVDMTGAKGIGMDSVLVDRRTEGRDAVGSTETVLTCPVVRTLRELLDP